LVAVFNLQTIEKQKCAVGVQLAICIVNSTWVWRVELFCLTKLCY